MPGAARSAGCVGVAAVRGRGAREEQAAPGSPGSGSGGSRERGEGSRGTAEPALLAQTPWKGQQVSLEDASTGAAGALRHPPRFFQGKITGPDAPQSPGAGLPHLQDTLLCTKHRGANCVAPDG